MQSTEQSESMENQSNNTFLGNIADKAKRIFSIKRKK